MNCPKCKSPCYQLEHGAVWKCPVCGWSELEGKPPKVNLCKVRTEGGVYSTALFLMFKTAASVIEKQIDEDISIGHHDNKTEHGYKIKYGDLFVAFGDSGSGDIVIRARSFKRHSPLSAYKTILEILDISVSPIECLKPVKEPDLEEVMEQARNFNKCHIPGREGDSCEDCLIRECAIYNEDPGDWG